MKHLCWIAALLCASPAFGGLDGSVFLMPIETSFSAHGQAMWADWLGQPDGSAQLEGTHGVYGPQTFESPFAVAGQYSYHLEGPADAGACYSTSLHVVATNRGSMFSDANEATFTGDTRCAPPPPPPKDPLTPGTEIDVTPSQGHTPIVIALKERYEFTSAGNGVDFDLDADGRADRVAWPRDGWVAFLFNDRNGNGVPDDGAELFGNHTPLSTGGTAAHGFEALAEFDANGDGAVTPADAPWQRLGLWQDWNHDGIASAPEITSLDANGIASLGVAHHWTGRRDAYGNILRWQSSVTCRNTGPRPYYDVYLTTISK